MFLAHAPWHGAYVFGGRQPVELRPLGISWLQIQIKWLTWTGVVNLLWLSVLVLCLAPLIWETKKESPFGWREFWIGILPFGVALNSSMIDGQTAVAIMNAVGFSLLGLFILRARWIRELFPVVKWGPAVLAVSLAISALLPLAMKTLGLDPGRIFHHSPPVNRYAGWTGEGTPMVLISVLVCTLGVALGVARAFSDSKLSRVQAALWMLAAAGGLAAIYYNIHRISLLAAAVGMLMAIYQALPKSRKVRFYTVSALILAAGIGFFNSPFFERTVIPLSEDASTWTTHPSYRGKTYEPMAPTGIWKFIPQGLDWSLSGRIGLAMRLSQRVGGNPVTGGGTGAAVRLVRSEEFKIVDEPQSDYLRYAIDHGLIGFVWLVVALVTLWRAAGQGLAGILVLLVALLMLTENILVYPAFGYGPFFLAAFIALRRAGELAK